MDLGGQHGAVAGEIPMPMPMSTGSFIHESSTNLLINNVHIEEEQQIKSKKTVRYRECMKNHAAAMGGNATDGCGEFMPSGEEGTLEALKCSACDCHRNFHRREVEGEPSCDCNFRIRDQLNRKRSGVLVSSRAPGTAAAAVVGPPDPFAFPPNNLLPRLPSQAIMSYSTGPSESDELEGTFLSRPAILKKRFRTKFTQEQKDRMLEFAEKVGWRIQKHDEQAVQQFCQDIGVKRRVLKVWMHNNKNTLGKKE